MPNDNVDLQPRFELTKSFVPADRPDFGAIAYEFGFNTLGGRRTAILSPAQVDSMLDLRKALGARGFSASMADFPWRDVQAELNRLMRSVAPGGLRAERPGEPNQLAEPAAVQGTKPWLLAPTSGWWPDGFLLHGLPVPPDARLALDPVVAAQVNCHAPVGSAEEERAALTNARHSCAAVLAVCAASSAPLLPCRRGVSAAGYAVVFVGPTSLGKTWATRVGLAVSADPLRLLPFRGSEPGFEHAALAHRHLPLVLDEPKSTRSGHRDVVQHIAYLIENGERAVLHPAYQGTRLRLETVVITGAEEGSLGDRSGGEKVRFVAVPCARMGPHGVIDQHEQAGVTDTDSAVLWQDRILGKLAENHGHTLPAVIQFVWTKGFPKVTRSVQIHMDSFLKAADKHLGKTDGVGLRARKTFAFFYAGGMVGVDAKALPWTRKRIAISILRCLRWHEQEARGASLATGAEAQAAEQLVAALRRCAAEPCVASAQMLEKRGAVHDRRAKEVRATDEFLCKKVGGRRALRLGLEELARRKLVLPGGKPGTWLRQVRYDDGRVRVVCFRPEVLLDASGQVA